MVRTPKDNIPEEETIAMPPLETRGGLGLWNRLDFIYPAYPKNYKQAILVKITTDQGIIGWGEGHAPLAPKVHKTVINDLLAPIILGQDARDVEVLWERMFSSQRLRGYDSGFFIASIAGIDLALWDILGKYVGLPVYRLLGGKYRDRVQTYSAYVWANHWRGGQRIPIGALKERALEALEKGYTALKKSMLKAPGIDLEEVVAVAEAIKGKGQLFVVSLGTFKLHEAVQIGRVLDQLGNIGWWQEPLMSQDTSGYLELVKALDTAICYGAFLSNRFRFRDALAGRAVDIINTNIAACGGLTESKRIAILADAYGVLWSPHVSMRTNPSIAASIHLAAATPNFAIMEDQEQHAGPLGNVLLKEPLVFHPGYAEIPERPGLGVEFDEKELAKVIVG